MILLINVKEAAGLVPAASREPYSRGLIRGQSWWWWWGKNPNKS